MEAKDHEAWVAQLIGTDSMRAAAQKAGYVQTTISRQLSRGGLSPEMVIALCRGYDRSPVTGLIETGYIEPWETEGVAIPYALEQATNQQILDEINRRSDPEARYLFTNDDDPDVVDIVEDAQVYELPKRGLDPGELQRVYDAMTEQERSLVERGKAPELRTMADLEKWRDDRMQARPELFRGVADSSPREQKEDDDHIS